MKKILSLFCSLAMVLSSISLVSADTSTSFTLNAEVTNGGQKIYQVVIDYANIKPDDKSIGTDSYEVVASGSSLAYRDASVASYGDFENQPRTITKVEVNGTKVTITMSEADSSAGTLAYLSTARNVPLDLTYEVRQTKDIPATAMDGTPQTILATTTYAWDNVVNDVETEKFVSVNDTINYQFYEPTGNRTNDSLVIWFHGNGEGDYENSQNNVAQMLANRGTVAWATDEAQKTFDGAYVMAFQSPDTWYNAQTKNYLETCYEEIQDVVSKYGINPSKIYVAGCSAGGYMTTRMIIKYPNLFAAANIICPALDVATSRGGETPTDEELMVLKTAKTKIWLVQADDDRVVLTNDCAKRIYDLIGEGNEVVTTVGEDKTYEKDNVIYTEYKTMDDKGTPKLPTQEDLNKDGISEVVLQNSHASWIMALLNLPQNSAGTSLWTWMANNVKADNVATGTQTIVVEGFDWGPAVTKTIVSLDKVVTNVNAADLEVFESKYAMNWSTFTASVTRFDRVVTNAYLSDASGNQVTGQSNYITIEMAVSPSDGSPFFYNFATGLNSWTTPYDLVVNLKDGATLASTTAITELSIDRVIGNKIMPLTDQFQESSGVFDGITMSYASYSPYSQVKDDSKKPLIIWLHGAGEGGYDTTIDILGNKVNSLIESEMQGYMNGAYVLLPQTPTMWMDDGTGSYTTDGTSKYTKALMELIETYVAQNPDVDTDRIYIGGCSNGGYMTMNMILENPTYFAAAFPICEAYSDSWITDDMLEKIVDLPIWFTHSKNDPTVNYESTSLATYNRLIAMGAKNVYLSAFEDVRDTSGLYKDAAGNPYEYNGHWSWIYFFNNECIDNNVTIFEWLSKQTKAIPEVKPEETPVVKPEETPEETPEVKSEDVPSKETPDTSDPTSMKVFGTLAVLSLAGYLALTKKKKDKQ